MPQAFFTVRSPVMLRSIILIDICSKFFLFKSARARTNPYRLRWNQNENEDTTAAYGWHIRAPDWARETHCVCGLLMRRIKSPAGCCQRTCAGQPSLEEIENERHVDARTDVVVYSAGSPQPSKCAAEYKQGCATK